MDGLQDLAAGRPRGGRERKPHAAVVIAFVALVSLAAVAWTSRTAESGPTVDQRAGTAPSHEATAERAPSGDERPGTAPSRKAAPLDGPFGRVGGWIAYNDGTGIWALNPRKAYLGRWPNTGRHQWPGVFSQSDYPDDAVRLADPAAGDPIAWSADGSRLLVARRPASVGPQEALFVLDADGTETRVVESADGLSGASISPDGTQVVYAAGWHPSRLELATVGDAPPEVLLRSEEGHLQEPAFSPEGSQIAFIAGGYDHSNALWVVDADGTARRRLAGGDWSHVDHLVWSPDGARLAFSCRCPTGTGVYTIGADGTKLTLASAPREDEWMPMPQWSPDGSQIALIHDDYDVIASGQPTTGTLVVVGAKGGEERRLARLRLSRVDGQANFRPVTIAWNPVR